MIVQHMQEALIKQIKDLFYNNTYKSEHGALEGIKVYSQNLPVNSNREDEDEDRFPCIICQVKDGVVSPNEPYIVRVWLLIGAYDKAKDRQGYQDVLHMMNVLYQHFSVNQVIGDEFVTDGALSWNIQETDTHPYYYGGIELYVEMPQTERISEYA